MGLGCGSCDIRRSIRLAGGRFTVSGRQTLAKVFPLSLFASSEKLFARNLFSAWNELNFFQKPSIYPPRQETF
jgi:hypothetical protein